MANSLVFMPFAGLALLALVPLVLTLQRRPDLRGRRDPAVALHRAQLEELDRELAEGRISPGDHAAARLEVQRRLLLVADLADTAPRGSGSRVLLAAFILVPIGAEALYLINGSPGMPDATPEMRQSLNGARQSEDDALVERLRATLASMDRKDDKLPEGYVLLGNVEAGRGHMKEAAAAWREALALSFEPTLAAQAAEAQVQVDGRVSAESAALFRRALALAPPDAPWRELARQRVGSVGGPTP
jgi:cytochrome c-type biogenesis protein CcmH